MPICDNASEKRTLELLNLLLVYGANAKSAVGELEQIAGTFEDGEENFQRKLSLDKAKAVRETIAAIETSGDYPKLIDVR